MKRAIPFFCAVCLCFILAPRAEAQRSKKKTPARTKTIPAQQGAERKRPAPVYNGSWSGKTAQQKGISFEVVNGQITTFSIGGRFSGFGCSTESNTRTTVNEPLAGNSFSVSAPGGPGGISVAADGKFVSPTKACGVVRMTLHPIPGPPPGVPGYVPSCGGSVETNWVASPGGVEQWQADPNCPAPIAQQEPERKQARYGTFPKQIQASPDGYFISDLVLGNPPGTVRLADRLQGRLIVERGPQAPSELVQIELYWSSPAGMLTNGAPIKLPSPGLESETTFEITVFSKRELDEALAFNATFTGKPKEALTELKAVVRVVRWDVAPGGVITGRKVLSNQLSATLKIIE